MKFTYTITTTKIQTILVDTEIPDGEPLERYAEMFAHLHGWDNVSETLDKSTTIHDDDLDSLMREYNNHPLRNPIND